jgi:hypothetical protein
VFTVDAGPEVWIDSASGRSGNQFYVSGVDDGAGSTRLWRSADGGATWTPLRTHTPAGGIYRNFDGGERVGLAVDSIDVDRPDARSCFFWLRTRRTGVLLLRHGAIRRRLDVLFPTAPGIPSNHQRIDTSVAPPFQIDFSSEPILQQGPVTLSEDSFGFGDAAFAGGVFVGESGGPVLGISLFPVALFADGFNTGSASRWSSTAPRGTRAPGAVRAVPTALRRRSPTSALAGGRGY